MNPFFFPAEFGCAMAHGAVEEDEFVLVIAEMPSTFARFDEEEDIVRGGFRESWMIGNELVTEDPVGGHGVRINRVFGRAKGGPYGSGKGTAGGLQGRFSRKAVGD